MALGGLDEAAVQHGHGAFGEPEQWRFDWEHTYTRDEWLEHVPTLGACTRLPKEALGELLDGVGAAVDAMGGSFTLPYATIVVTAVRIDRA